MARQHQINVQDKKSTANISKLNNDSLYSH